MKISIKQICIGAAIFMYLLTGIIFIPYISTWVTVPVVLFCIMPLVGFLIALVLKIRSNGILESLLYAFGLGLSFLLVGGLFLNWMLLSIGSMHPLSASNIAIFMNISAFLLCISAYYSNRDYFLSFSLKRPQKKNLLFAIIPLAFPVLSIFGSAMLNSSSSGAITLFLIFAIAVYVAVLSSVRKEFEEWVYASALYSIGLSLLLMYSLRSVHILGWDIHLEYQVFQATLTNLAWKMSYFPGLDYNACMSITILPTIFKVLTKLSSEYIFKVVFQLLFAIAPIAVYVLARKFLKQKFAFLASFLFISQTWFFEQMPALIRQEIAFMLYLLLLLVLFNYELSRRARYSLLVVFSLALVLSHYSTAYIWFALLIGFFLLSAAVNFFNHDRKIQNLKSKFIAIFIILALLLGWQVFLTNTGGALGKLIAQADPAAPSNESPIAGPEQGTTTTNGDGETGSSKKDSIFANVYSGIRKGLFIRAEEDFNEKIRLALDNAVSKHPGGDAYSIYPLSETAGYVPQAMPGGYSDPVIPAFAETFLSGLIRILKLLFINIFPIIGIIGIYLRSNRDSNSVIKQDFALFNIVAYGLIVLMVLVPLIQQHYNLTRLYLQMFLTLGILAIMGGQAAIGRFKKYELPVLTVMVVMIFLSLTGAFDHIIGRETRITLSNPPAIHDSFYVDDREVASAQWLASNRDSAYRVQADLIANLRLQSFGNTSADYYVVSPVTLERESYLYLIRTNIHEKKNFHLYKNELLVYDYPLGFIDAHKSLIYNNGGSRIYK